MVNHFKRVIDLDSDLSNYNNFIDPQKMPLHHIIFKLNTNSEGYEFLEHYLTRLQEAKALGQYIKWDKFCTDMIQHFKCSEEDIDNVMLDLFYAEQYLELCRDYTKNKDLHISLEVDTEQKK